MRRAEKRGLTALLLSMSLTIPSGCEVGGHDPTPVPAGAPEAAPESVRGTIGFSALTLTNPFFTVIANSMKEALEKHGYRLIINDAERDVNRQANHVDDYITQRVTAIVLNPADRIAIGPAIKKANEAGIPVFTCDLQYVAPDAKIAGHVGTDNYQGGRLAGDAMIQALGEAGGEVLILHFKQANSCVLRVKGFREVIARHNEGRRSGKIEIVSELDGGGLRDEGFRAASDALQAHPDLAGIFAINDPSGLGAWRALKQANKQDQIKIVAFDGQLEGKQAIKEGKFYADPVQFPAKMGAITAQNILKYLDGEEFERVQLIPTVLYTKADADKDPDLQ
ncbi:MAG: substrate-binding domain-containing protein [Planctomycetota bacterium]|nr:substrate-binding domain-containing protein [Planctomycetota bacterium]